MPFFLDDILFFYAVFKTVEIRTPGLSFDGFKNGIYCLRFSIPIDRLRHI